MKQPPLLIVVTRHPLFYSLSFSPYALHIYSSSVYLAIANGETSLEKGFASASRVQSIAVGELKEELNEYIRVAGGVEGIELSTFKSRLKVVTLPDEGEVLIALGKVL